MSPPPRSSSNSPDSASPTPSTSRINLPPSSTDLPSSYLEGSVPGVLADRSLGLHSKPPPSTPFESTRSAASTRESSGTGLGEGEGAKNRERESLLKALFGNGDKRAGRGETQPLLQSLHEGNGDGVEEEEEDEEEDEDEDTRRRRSKSVRRKLKWHQRPSPFWFLPGTGIFAITIGMLISPKLELYTQLVCRSIGAEKSGTTLPAPSNTLGYSFANVRVNHSEEKEDTASDYVRRIMVANPPSLSYSTSSTTLPKPRAGDGTDDGDSWEKQCRRSPAVQRLVTGLATTLTLLLGILSALTTGHWGALSDRIGRIPIMSLAVVGTILMDIGFLAVVEYHDVLGYEFLLVGPLLDGLLGGWATAQATTNAYLSDCTSPGSRARIFSLLGGLLFGGIALGPIVGSISIALTGSFLFPFYLSLALHVIYLGVIWFLIPESLSQKRMKDARTRFREEKEEERKKAEREDSEASGEGGGRIVLVRVRRSVGKLFWFARPLNLLLPKRRREGEREEDKPVLERGRVQRKKEGSWDLELSKVSVSYGLYVSVASILSVKILYASYKFDWGPEENGFYLTFTGACRVIVLIVLLPLLIKAFRKPPPLPLSDKPQVHDLADGLLATPEHQDEVLKLKEWEKEALYLRVLHDSHFDLFLARSSILIDVLGYAFMALNQGSTTLFVASTFLQSFGCGATPALQSLALAMAAPRDVGRLFASLSVLSSLSAQVIGPALFGIIFIKSVGFAPELMFWVAVALFSVSLGALLAVRLEKRGKEEERREEHLGEERGGGRLGRAARGRSLTRKGNGGFANGGVASG